MLAGKNNEEKIWNYLKSAGLNDFGTAGLMGNLYAESGLIPNNVENLYEKRLGVTDASYTAAVDSGKYQFFATDKAGYGLAQWTYCSRKAELLDYAQCCRKSIGDLEMQLDFLMKEDGSMYCLEANTLPGMTPTSLLPQEAAVLGIDYAQLCEKLIEISMRKYQK